MNWTAEENLRKENIDRNRTSDRSCFSQICQFDMEDLINLIQATIKLIVNIFQQNLFQTHRNFEKRPVLSETYETEEFLNHISSQANILIDTAWKLPDKRCHYHR
jgi:hypothetical protein